MALPIKFAVLLVLALGLPPFVVAWLTSLQLKPFRYWASHPWAVFWASWPVMIVSFVIMAFVEFLRPFWWVVSLLSLAVWSLSAVQGLRLTWNRSRRKAVLIVLGSLAFALPASIINGPAIPDQDLLQFLLISLGTVFGIFGWWVLMALASEYLARRLSARLQHLS